MACLEIREALRCGRRYGESDQLYFNGILLADLADAIEALSIGVGGAIDATPIAMQAIDYTTIAAAAGAYVAGLTDAHDKRRTVIYNRTDEDIIVSYDNGSTDHEILGPGSSVTVNWGELGLVLPTSIRIRNEVGVLSTTGKVYISATY